jgi:hypothetical protein
MIGPGLPGIGSASTTATVSRTIAHQEDARLGKAEVEQIKRDRAKWQSDAQLWR